MYFIANTIVLKIDFLITGQRLLQKVCGNDTGQGGGGGGGIEQETPQNSNTTDNDTKNLVLQNLDAVHALQQQLLQLWHHKKLKLDQCFQLRLFEQDCEKVLYAKTVKHSRYQT